MISPYSMCHYGPQISPYLENAIDTHSCDPVPQCLCSWQPPRNSPAARGSCPPCRPSCRSTAGRTLLGHSFWQKQQTWPCKGHISTPCTVARLALRFLKPGGSLQAKTWEKQDTMCKTEKAKPNNNKTPKINPKELTKKKIMGWGYDPLVDQIFSMFIPNIKNKLNYEIQWKKSESNRSQVKHYKIAHLNGKSIYSLSSKKQFIPQ